MYCQLYHPTTSRRTARSETSYVTVGIFGSEQSPSRRPHSVIMGRQFRIYLAGESVYMCRACGNHLAVGEFLISKVGDPYGLEWNCIRLAILLLYSSLAQHPPRRIAMADIAVAILRTARAGITSTSRVSLGHLSAQNALTTCLLPLVAFPPIMLFHISQ